MYWEREGKCFISTGGHEFCGWEFMGKEHYKRGVWKVFIRTTITNPPEFRTVFTSTKHLPKVIKGVCV